MKNTSSERVEKDNEAYIDLGKLANLIEKLRTNVGDVRDNERYQLAYKIGVSASALRKFQTPGMSPDFDTLQTLIAYYYPGKILAPDGGLQKRTGRVYNYWVKLTTPRAANSVEYL
jgi:hypothetical protein